MFVEKNNKNSYSPTERILILINASLYLASAGLIFFGKNSKPELFAWGALLGIFNLFLSAFMGIYKKFVFDPIPPAYQARGKRAVRMGWAYLILGIPSLVLGIFIGLNRSQL